MHGPLSFLGDERNLFGVCAALGHDFGFDPIWLRVILGVSLLWNPVFVLSAYAIAGVVVFLSHWIFPNRRRADGSGDAILI